MGISPSANFCKKQRFVSQDPRVCFLTSRLMNNQIKGGRKATSHQKKRESEDKSSVALVQSLSQLGCILQDSDALDSQGTKEFRRNLMQKVLNAIQRVRFTKSTLRHASIRDKKGASLGKIQVKPRHQRSPYATKFEDRCREETERQERCAQSKAWNRAKNISKLKEKDKVAFYFSPAEEVGSHWLRPAKEPEER